MDNPDPLIQQILLRYGVDEASAKRYTSVVKDQQSSVLALTSAYADLQKTIDGLNLSTDQMIRLNSTVATVQGQAVAGASAGADTGGGDTGGGGSVGSLYGIGRGLRIGGSMLHAPALTEAGGLLYIEQAFQQIDKVVGPLNEKLLNSSGLIGTMSSGLDAMGVPMAGLVTVIAPLAVGLGVIAADVVYWNSVMKDSTEIVKDAVGELDVYYKAIESGTTDQIKNQLALAEAAKTSADMEVQKYQTAIDNARNQAFQQSGAAGQLVTELSPQMGVLKDALDKAQKAAQGASDKIDGLNQALGSTQVAANDAAAALQKQADEAVKYQVYESDQAQKLQKMKETATAAQVQTAIDADRAELEAKMTLIGNLSQLSGQSAADAKAAEPALAAARLRMFELQDEIAALTQDVLPAAQALDQTKVAAKDAATAIKDLGKNLDDLAKTRDKIVTMEQDQAAKVQAQKEADARVAERQSVENSFAAQIAQAKQDEAIAAQKEATNDKLLKDQQSYNDTSIKENQKFLTDEAAAQAKYTTDRAREIQDDNDSLLQLAADGDVLKFLQAQQADQKKLQREQEDFATADAKRIADHNLTLKEQQDAQAKLLASDQAAGNDRLAQIEQQGKAANTKSAQLEAELNAIREQWRRDDLARQQSLEQAQFAQRLSAEQAHQADLLNSIASYYAAQAKIIFNAFANPIIPQVIAPYQPPPPSASYWNMLNAPAPPVQGPPTSLSVQGPPAPADYYSTGGGGGSHFYAKGISYVPYDQMAVIHKGERVLTAQDNAAYSKGANRGTVIINNTVGDVASLTALNSAKAEMYEDINSMLAGLN